MTEAEAAASPPNRSNLRRRLLRVGLRVAVTVLALAFIAWRVDFAELWMALRSTNPALVVLALALFPFRFLVQAVRWRLLLAGAVGVTLSFRRTIRVYWMGLGIGWFTPASLGADVYRVGVASRQLGRPVVNATVVILEKLLTLVACVVVVAVSWFFVPDAIEGRADDVNRIGAIVAIGLGALVVGVLAARFTLRTKLVRWFDVKIQRMIAGLLARLRERTRLDVRIPEGGIRSVLRALMSRSTLAPGLMLSMGVPLLAAVGGQIMFRAVGYDVPFAVNVFVAPLIILVTAIPISVGSIGVRESAAIILYGMFGVPADIALLVSLLNLLGILTNTAAGALLFLVRHGGKELEPATRVESTPSEPTPPEP